MVSCSVTGGTSARTSFKGFSLMEYNFITKLKSNMKGALMSVSDRLLLRKRAIIETVNDELKNIAQVEHSGHRCFDNFIVNLLGAIAAYCLFPKKPCINLQRTIDTQLALFWIRRTHVIYVNIIGYTNFYVCFTLIFRSFLNKILKTPTGATSFTEVLPLVWQSYAFRVWEDSF